MTLTLLPAAGRTPKPWKNGGGVTTDVFVWPEGAGLENFLARLSIAEVASDGPFSVFAGIDRTTAILSGGGFELTFEGGDSHFLESDTPHLSYSGDIPAFSRLRSGPTTDLNVMSRRGRMTHGLTRYHLESPMKLGAMERAVVFVATGAMTVASAAETLSLCPLDACRLENAAVTLTPQPRATVFLARFCFV